MKITPKSPNTKNDIVKLALGYNVLRVVCRRFRVGTQIVIYRNGLACLLPLGDVNPMKESLGKILTTRGEQAAVLLIVGGLSNVVQGRTA